MLGSLKKRQKWAWSVSGKHPAGRDYFRTATDHPLLGAFSEWIEKGYDQLETRSKSANDAVSWRFWAQGGRSETLVCGIGRDSCDTLGRPYPLLILGAGPLDGWRKHLDLLPLAMDATWKQMESLAVGRFTDLQGLKTAVGSLLPPDANWRRVSGRRAPQPVRAGGGLAPERQFESGAAASQPWHFIEIKGADGQHPQHLAGLCGAYLNNLAGSIPSAFFMGGLPERSYLAFFSRPLNVRDFVRLWSVGAGASAGRERRPGWESRGAGRPD